MRMECAWRVYSTMLTAIGICCPNIEQYFQPFALSLSHSISFSSPLFRCHLPQCEISIYNSLSRTKCYGFWQSNVLKKRIEPNCAVQFRSLSFSFSFGGYRCYCCCYFIVQSNVLECVASHNVILWCRFFPVDVVYMCCLFPFKKNTCAISFMSSHKKINNNTKEQVNTHTALFYLKHFKVKCIIYTYTRCIRRYTYI